MAGSGHAPKMKVGPVNGDNRFTNRAYMYSQDMKIYRVESISKLYLASVNDKLVVRLSEDNSIKKGEIGLNDQHCSFAQTSIGDSATVTPFNLPHANFDITELYLQLKFSNNIEIYARDLEKKLKDLFNHQVLCLNQSISFEYKGVIGAFTVVRIFMAQKNSYNKQGMISQSTKIFFNSSSIKILNQEYVPKTMFWREINKEAAEQELMLLGIGGMGGIFTTIFQRVIATRIHQGPMIEHVKGILLYGPPGTGKTLLAAKLAEILGAKLKVVNGPELLAQWMGESEQNVRKLFDEAISDYKTHGDQSSLHVIILDEIDSIAQKRGRNPADTGGDRVVNQLLAMINGVNGINNILVIGTTNRKDLIDDALLRSGRLELHIEVGLPDETSRQNILKVHMEQLPREIMLLPDINLQEIAKRTSGLSGADLASIVKHAVAHASCTISDKSEQTKISHRDFIQAMDEKRPTAYKKSLEAFENLRSRAMIKLDSFYETSNVIKGAITQFFHSEKHNVLTCLLFGPCGCGKTTLAAFIPENVSFQYVEMVSSNSLIELSKEQKVEKLVQVFEDAKKFQSSFILLDNLERLVEYNPLGGTCSGTILNTLLDLLKESPENNKMLVVGTTNNKSIMEKMGLYQVFTLHLEISLLQQRDILQISKYFNVVSLDEMEELETRLSGVSLKTFCKLIDMLSMGKLEDILTGQKHIDIEVFFKYLALFT